VEYQDALAVLGVGTAHPGGLDSTMMWIKEIPWTNSMSVLDVGCGTGRSLLEIKRRAGCTVCGVDVRSKMIAKAEKRAAQLGVTAKWLVADAESLPFGDEAFDVVVTESVNVFLQPGNALQEYYRVLKQGGWYVDVEMLTLAPVPPEWKSSAMQVYGAKLVPDQSEWKRLYRAAGFVDLRVLGTRAVVPEQMMETDQKYPDEVNLADNHAYANEELVHVLSANAAWLEKHHKWLGYGVFLMRKPKDWA
jgi:ubiquinone/menaquinone biosynthesis C-methylase UbiE